VILIFLVFFFSFIFFFFSFQFTALEGASCFSKKRVCWQDIIQDKANMNHNGEN